MIITRRNGCARSANCKAPSRTAAPTVHGTLKLLDDAGIAGELVLREMRQGRVETIQDWGRPESFRREFRRLRAQ